MRNRFSPRPPADEAKSQRSSNNKRLRRKPSSNHPSVALNCTIYHAEDIDRREVVAVQERNYYVVLSVEPGKEYRTETKKGLLNPTWKEKCSIPIARPWDYPFLNVEVIRCNSSASRPGTSTGRVAVGRAKIPIPQETFVKKLGRFGLVRLDGMEVKGEGYIAIEMELTCKFP